MALVLLLDICEQQCSLISSRDPEDNVDEDISYVISKVKCIRAVV